MQGGHIDAGAPEHGLFADATFPETDVLGCGGDNVHEKALMFFVRAGEKAADGVNGLVLLFQHGAQIGIGAAFGRVVHTVGFLGKHGNRITV